MLAAVELHVVPGSVPGKQGPDSRSRPMPSFEPLFVRSLCPQHRQRNAQARAGSERTSNVTAAPRLCSFARFVRWAEQGQRQGRASPAHAIPSLCEADAGHLLAGRGRGEWLKPPSFSTPCPAAARRTQCHSNAAGTATAAAKPVDGKARPHGIAGSLNHPAAPAPAVQTGLAEALLMPSCCSPERQQHPLPQQGDGLGCYASRVIAGQGKSEAGLLPPWFGLDAANARRGPRHPRTGRA